MLQLKSTPYFLRALYAICFCVFTTFNLHMYELTQSQHYIQQFINESYYDNYNGTLSVAQVKLTYGLLSAAMYFSAFLGIFGARYLIDRIGRRMILFRINGMFDLLASTSMFAARVTNRFELLFLGRLSWGVQWGSHMVAVSTYLGEIAPPNVRGSASALTMVYSQAVVVVLYSFGLPQLFNTYELFHWQFALSWIPAIVSFVAYFFVPESPKYLYINKNKHKEAREVIKELYGSTVEVEKAIKSFDGERHQCSQKLSLRTIIKDPALRTSLALSTCLALARITSGGVLLNQFAFILYTEDLSLSSAMANYITVGVSVLQTVASVGGLLLIDRAGRRPLVLSGMFGSALLAVLYVVTTTFYEQTGFTYLLYMTIAIVWMVLCAFPLCLAMVTYYTTAEITTQQARAATSAASVSVATAVRIFYFFIFPILNVWVGVYTMIILVAIPSTAIAIYLAIELPETRRRAADDVVNQIIRKKSSQVLNLSDLKVAQAKMELEKITQESNGTTKQEEPAHFSIGEAEPELEPDEKLEQTEKPQPDETPAPEEMSEPKGTPEPKETSELKKPSEHKDTQESSNAPAEPVEKLSSV